MQNIKIQLRARCHQLSEQINESIYLCYVALADSNYPRLAVCTATTENLIREAVDAAWHLDNLTFGNFDSEDIDAIEDVESAEWDYSVFADFKDDMIRERLAMVA